MINLISCGIKKEHITDEAFRIISNSEIVIGNEWLLKQIPDGEYQKLNLDLGFIKNLKCFIAENLTKEIVFLASGDSLFNGIGGTLSKMVDLKYLNILPNTTAAQTLFAKLKIPWQNVNFFSVHGKEKLLNYHAIFSSELAVIYCDDKLTASQAAAELEKIFPICRDRNAVIAENLGRENERIIKGTISELKNEGTAGLSMLLLLPNTVNKVNDPGLPLGLSDNEFNKYSNCITHSEVRSIIVSKLKIGHGVIWDLGAGSGSVGIEAALLCRDAKVYAVEKEKERVENIKENRLKLGTSNLAVFEGDILDTIEELPSPRGVFIGGGGSDIPEIMERTFEKLLPGGRIVVSSVLLETFGELYNLLKDSCKEILNISINRAVALNDKKMMKPDNTITIFVYEKEYEK